MGDQACSHKVLKSQKVRAAFIELSLYSEKQNERLVGDHDSAKASKDRDGDSGGFYFFFCVRALAPNLPARPWGGSPPRPSARKSATQTAQKTALCAPCEHPGGSESENRAATRGTAHSEVQGDDRGTARCTARCRDRPMAALHFLPPTGHSRSGRRSFDSKLISLLPLDEVPVHVHRFAARAPCDSQGSECQCGIHRAEAASALRSRKTERRRRKNRRQSHKFFLAPAAPASAVAAAPGPPTPG